jgi:hypothetical protein
VYVFYELEVCEIFYWRDVTTCFIMTYIAKGFDVFYYFTGKVSHGR